MRNRVEISDELREISLVIAQMGSENLYQAPEGYFENLADAIMDKIRMHHPDANINEPEAFAVLINPSVQQAPFYIPDGYFETFAEKLISKIKGTASHSSTEELKDISSLLSSIDKRGPYHIPDGYFENFAGKLISSIKAAEADSVSEELETLSPLLSQLSRKAPFSIPDDYFSELSHNAIAGAKAVEFVNDELENLSPLMNGLKGIHVYKAPEGYFQNLPDTVINKIKKPQQARVIALHNRKNWLRYAAAAAVIGIIATSTLFIFNNKFSPKSFAYANIDGNQLTDSLQNTNDEDILSYMQSHNIQMTDTSNSVALLDLNDNDADDMLADVSDNELQQYANDNYSNKELNTN